MMMVLMKKAVVSIFNLYPGKKNLRPELYFNTLLTIFCYTIFISLQLMLVALFLLNFSSLDKTDAISHCSKMDVFTQKFAQGHGIYFWKLDGSGISE